MLWDQDLDYYKPKPHAKGYYRDGQIVEIDAETSRLMGLDRTFDELDITTDTKKPNDKWIFSIVASKSLYRGAEISLFVENIFNDRAFYFDRRGLYRSRNPEIFWGIAFSSKLNNLFK